jgi:hypothetical protein
VWQLSSRTEAIRPHKKDKKIYFNTITHYSPSRFRASFSSFIQRIQYPRKRFFSYRLQFLVTVCWIDGTASTRAPFVAIVNLGNKNSQPALNQGSRVDRMTRGSLVSPKTQRQRPKNAPLHCRAEGTRTHFPETGLTR